MDIRKLILNSEPPFEWNNDETHPIHSLGYYVFGIYDGFIFDEEAVNDADEELLKKIYGEIADIGVNKIFAKINILNT